MATASPVLQLGLLRMRPLQRWLKPRVPHNAWRHGRLHIRVNQACVTALTPWKNPRWMEKGVATGLVHTRKVVTTDRLGGAVQRQTDLRPLVEDGERLPHQLLGNASRLSSLPVFPAGPNRTPCADSLRCNGCMPVRAVCKPHSPDLKRGALATDARGCSLWGSLLERPPPAPESRVRDPLGELVRTRVGGVTLVPWPRREWGLGGWV